MYLWKETYKLKSGLFVLHKDWPNKYLESRKSHSISLVGRLFSMENRNSLCVSGKICAITASDQSHLCAIHFTRLVKTIVFRFFFLLQLMAFDTKLAKYFHIASFRSNCFKFFLLPFLMVMVTFFFLSSFLKNLSYVAIAWWNES